MDKKALRAEIRAKKRALTEEQIVRYSEELAQKLFAHPLYQAAKSIYADAKDINAKRAEAEAAAVIEDAPVDAE